MKKQYLINLDMAELTLRMVEAGMQIKRPAEHTPLEALKSLPEDMEDAFHRAARAAADYFGEVMAAAMGSNLHHVDLNNDGAGHA